MSQHLLKCMLSRLGQTDIVEAKSRPEAIVFLGNMRASESFDIVFLDLTSTDLRMFLRDINSGVLPCLVGIYVALTHCAFAQPLIL